MMKAILTRFVLAAIVAAFSSSLGAVPVLADGDTGGTGLPLCTPAMEERGECETGNEINYPYTKPSWLQKLEDRVYLSPVVGTSYRFVERLERNEAGEVVYDENNDPVYEKRSGRLVTLAALHYSIKPYLSAFVVYGLEHANPKDTFLRGQFGQMVGLGVTYVDYVGFTLGVCVEIADGGGWESFTDEKNYVMLVGVVVHGLDWDLTGVTEGLFGDDDQ